MIVLAYGAAPRTECIQTKAGPGGVRSRANLVLRRQSRSSKVGACTGRCCVVRAKATPEERVVKASSLEPLQLEGDNVAVATQPLPLLEEEQEVHAAKQEERRRRICTLAALFFAMALNNLAKVNLSVAIVPMAAEFGWNSTAQGLVSSAFFWGYMLTQLPGGYLASKVGGKVVLWSAVILFSVGTFLGPATAAMSLTMLCFSRFLVGLGEGVCPSTVTSVLATTISKEERGRAVTTVFGGQDVGSVIGLLLIPIMIGSMGWQSVFTYFGMAGFVWAAVTHFMGFSQPVRTASHGDALTAEPTPWKAFMLSKPVWALSVAHFAWNWFYYALLAWLPSLFNSWMSLPLSAAAMMAIVPSVASFMMATVAGAAVDGLISSNRMTVTQARKFAQTLGFMIPCLCLIGIGLMMTSGANMTALVPRAGALALLTCAFGFGSWTRAGVFCNHQDISRQYAGVLLGITNTWAAIASLLGVMCTGVLLDLTKSWTWSLVVPLCGVLLIGTVVFNAFGEAEPIDFHKTVGA